MELTLKMAVVALAAGLVSQAFAQVTFYEYEHFRGRTFASKGPVCEDTRFGGRFVVLRKGSYDSLSGMGINDRISSARPIGNSCQYDNPTRGPIAVAAYEYRRRPSERVFNAPVTSVRAVVGPPSERCWLERERVVGSGSGDRRCQHGSRVLGCRSDPSARHHG